VLHRVDGDCRRDLAVGMAAHPIAMMNKPSE
jgi:hypothetical protein